jgi:hypothetical protein
MVDITVFPMRNFPDGSAGIAEYPYDPEFWDILVRDENGDVLHEADDLPTSEAAEAAVESFLLKYPQASVDYV